MLVGAAILLGACLGVAAGGTMSSLSSVRLGCETALIAVFVLQGVVRSTGWFAQLTVPVWAVCAVCLIVLLASQRRRPGVALMMLGTGMNTFVVLLNVGMPVVLGESDPAHVRTAVSSMSFFYHVADSTDVLVTLGDVLIAPGDMLASLGDLLLIVGVVVFLSASSRAATMDECP